MSNVATIAPGMYKLDPVILAPKVKNNREAHEYYLKHTMEQAAILRKVVGMNEYLRKGRKTKPKRQNRTQNGKARKVKSKFQAKQKKSTESHPEAKVNEILSLGTELVKHALYTEKAGGILYVTDVGKQDYIGMCVSAAKRAGWLTEDHSEYLLSHVGFGLSTKVDNLVGLLDEAISRCKALLAGQAGMADEWTAEDLDHAAEALGYCVLKLANYTFDFDQMLNKEAEELVLKNDDERELGLHLLRFTKVGGSGEETSRLLLCEPAEVVVRKCFNLLGIAPISKL
ncbi:anticodon-binding aminoacyl-tRNA synthetase, class 1a [Tanacetum coccineum]